MNMIRHDDVPADRDAVFGVRALTETYEGIVNRIGREQPPSSIRASGDEENRIAREEAIESGRDASMLVHWRERIA